MKKKLVVFDIDGTLVTAKNTVLPSTLEAVAALKEAGHRVTIATGRSRFLVEDILAELDLSTYVLCNGAAAFHEHKQIISKPLDKVLLKRLTAFMDQANMAVSLTAIDQMARVTANHSSQVQAVMASIGASLPPYNQAFIDTEDIYQGLGFYSSEMDGSFEDRFPELRFVRWLDDCVDIIHRDNSKAVAVLELADALDIPKSDIIAFGDGNNDLEILSEAGLGIAMGNASANVKAAADIVTDSNEEHGIYHALKRIKII